MTKLGFENMPVRFFIWSYPQDDFIECDESNFIEAEGIIGYERHSVFENGVKQICLTKNPFKG